LRCGFLGEEAPELGLRHFIEQPLDGLGVLDEAPGLVLQAGRDVEHLARFADAGGQIERDVLFALGALAPFLAADAAHGQQTGTGQGLGGGEQADQARAGGAIGGGKLSATGHGMAPS
jgi:hypothetical protein